MKGKAPTKFKTPDGKEFDTRAEWRDYMMATFYSYKNKHDEPEPLIKPPGSIDGQIFDIADCSNTTMAILDHCEQVQIDMIKNCKVMVGACASSIFIRNCENTTFYTCCRQLRLRDCVNCKFYIYSMSEVHIEYSNNVTFAPFRGGYPEHGVHLSRANLDVSHNLWYDIFDHNDPGKTHEHWSLIPESEYEPEWFPLGPCENAVPYAAPGSVAKFVDDSSMQSFSIQPPAATAPPAALVTPAVPPAPPASTPVAPPQPAVPPPVTSSAKHVAIIGTGKVGTTLGLRLLEAGWQVTYGSRNPTSENVTALLNTQQGAKATSLTAAVDAAQFIILAVPSMVEMKAYQDLAVSLGPGAAAKVPIKAYDQSHNMP